jgi:solute carrier family 25 phosphate transporter 3
VAGGVVSSSIRWAVLPLDVVKVQMQVNPTQYSSLPGGLRRLFREDGVRGLFRGLGPTALAYGCQTGTKYGAYEVLKDRISTLAGQEHAERYRGLIFVTAAGLAEACADVLMCPFEMLKIQVQSTSGRSFPRSTLAGLLTMMRHSKQYSFPFGALPPLWGRQIPSTVANFYVFENVVDAVYRHVLHQRPRDDYSAPTQLGVTLLAGYVAGSLSAIVSHPADTLVSMRSMPEHRGKSSSHLVREKGLWRLATAGLGPRVLLTGGVIAGQWILYDSFKCQLGMGTSGGRH